MFNLSKDGIQLNTLMHNCRPDTIKYKYRDSSSAALILSRGLSRTKETALYMQEKYLINMLQNRQQLCLEIRNNFPNTYKNQNYNFL